MLKKFLIIILFAAGSLQAQVVYETIESTKLGETRELKIQLPRGYTQNQEAKYPLILVLDGDYLFEPVAGNTDYFAYWEDMPDALVVGINQFDKRYDDCMYAEENSLPVESGAAFFEFLGMELIPYLEKIYRLEPFRVIIGHGETANFINYYLLKSNPVFQAYVAISPDLSPDITSYLSERLPLMEKKLFYYLCTSANDVPSIRDKTLSLHQTISALVSNRFLYKIQEFDEPSHYALPANAIPKALETIFLLFKPISKDEYQETILKLEVSPVDYLIEKYETIKELFGIEKQILVNDFKAIAAAIEKNEKYEDYENLSKLARKNYPETLLSSYYLARFYEETGSPKKAMKTYQSAFILEEIAGLTKDLMLERAEAIKADFGY